jgi:fatty acid desaturase
MVSTENSTTTPPSPKKISERDALQAPRQQAEAADDPATAAPAPAEKAVPRRRRGAKLGLIAVIALVVAVHLGLGGLLLVSGPWRHWVIGTVLAVILAKAIFVLGRLLIRRNKAREAC